jgi:signal peptidase I
MFTPRYVKAGRAMLKNARKLLHYRRDLLDAREIERLETQMRELYAALRSRNRAAVEASAQRLDRQFSKHFPPQKDAVWRENCEVFLVAIVIAVGVRSYFLQPFTIPTGSMQPTLNGIKGVPTESPRPNIVKRIVDFVVLGRTYINVVSEVRDQVVMLNESKRFRFFTFTEIRCVTRRYVVHAPKETLERDFGVGPGVYEAGEPIARGYVSAGDHVFVDKMSYHFRFPQRDEVFVFKTTGIADLEARQDPRFGSQFYIKRLVGLPGDRLRIEPPRIYINGEIPKAAGMERVMSLDGGYRGYSNGPAGLGKFRFLTTPQSTFRVPPSSYFALGDNSYSSLDSRAWGIVPQRNVMGRGFFVYWPFTSHWGLIE